MVKLHLTELEFVVLGHTQFEALTKYCTPDELIAMESHVKVSWSMLISVSVIFGGGKNSTKILYILLEIKGVLVRVMFT